MIYALIVTHDDITLVVSKIAEQIGRIQGELIESNEIDVIGMRKTLIQIKAHCSKFEDGQMSYIINRSSLTGIINACKYQY